MVIVGLWLGIIGYAVLYAGVNKLGGGNCTFGQALKGGCQPAAAQTGASSGVTLLSAQQAVQAQQSAAVPVVPVPATGFTP